MGTLIFDFDSTLVSCESLEELLGNDPKLAEITRRAMEGEIPFKQALEDRLNNVSLSRGDVIDFGLKMRKFLTPGIEELIKKINVPIWVISGGLQEIITPLCLELGIPREHIHGVNLNWSTKGQFLGVNHNDPLTISKVEGAKKLVNQWTSPKIMIGDGMTDYELYKKGLVDTFIAFTQHVKRKRVIKTGAPSANSIDELYKLLIPALR